MGGAHPTKHRASASREPPRVYLELRCILCAVEFRHAKGASQPEGSTRREPAPFEACCAPSGLYASPARPARDDFWSRFVHGRPPEAMSKRGSPSSLPGEASGARRLCVKPASVPAQNENRPIFRSGCTFGDGALLKTGQIVPKGVVGFLRPNNRDGSGYWQNGSKCREIESVFR